VPKTTVSEYLEWFEDAYFLFRVRRFDASLARSQANPKKIYCIDHALVTSVASGILVNAGHLFENLVFTTLRRLHPEIYYYKTRAGREVDFLVPMRKRANALIQACESLVDPQTKKREVAALDEAMGELKIKTATIVTRNEHDEVDAENGTIEVVPAWRFLLDLPDRRE
jgi:predicted AAA+ superfamily ATPase